MSVERIGLTRLSQPETDDGALVDIVFVHGLFGHPQETWEYHEPDIPVESSVLSTQSSAPVPEAFPSFPARSLRQKFRFRNRDKPTSVREPESLDGVTQHGRSTSSSSNKLDVRLNTDAGRSKGFGGGDYKLNGHDGPNLYTNKCPAHLDYVVTGALSLHTTKSMNSISYRSQSSHVFWIRDLLAPSMQKARIFTWGFSFESAEGDMRSASKINDCSAQLLSDLTKARKSKLQSIRPLLFVVHGMSGLIIKNALSTAKATKKQVHLDILWSAIGILFLDTPHRASPEITVADVFRQRTRDPSISSHIELKDSETCTLAIEKIERQFQMLLLDEQFWLHSCSASPSRKDPAMTDTHSGCFGVDDEEYSQSHKTHSHMTRFSSAEDVDYKRLHAVLDRWRDDIDKNHEVAALALMKSLDTAKMRFRIETIPPNLADTLAWVFAETKLPAWLQDRSKNPVFFIEGKPGSGKTTTMKYILEHPQTRMLLEEDSPGPWMISGYFFYDRGTRDQNTLYGLLVKILHDMLDHNHDLARHVLSDPEQISSRPRGFTTTHLTNLKDRGWREEQLKRAIEVVVSQSTTSFRLCMFIDALDEDQGPHWQLLETLKDLFVTSCSPESRVKLCLASRPEKVFYRLRQCESFKMQDHTYDDIVTYTKKMFSTSGMADTKKQYLVRWATNYIIEKARGVFIWVKVATYLFIEGIHDRDSDEELQGLLEDVPYDLEILYTEAIRRMLQRLQRRPFSTERRLREAFEAHAMFQLTLHAKRPYEVRWFLDLVTAILAEAFVRKSSLRAGPASSSIDMVATQDLSRVGFRDTEFSTSTRPKKQDSSLVQAPENALHIASRSAGLLETVIESVPNKPADDNDWESVADEENDDHATPLGSMGQGVISSKVEEKVLGPGHYVQFIHQSAREHINKAVLKSDLLKNQTGDLRNMQGPEMFFLGSFNMLCSAEAEATQWSYSLPKATVVTDLFEHAWILENKHGISVEAFLTVLDKHINLYDLALQYKKHILLDDVYLQAFFEDSDKCLLNVAAATGLRLTTIRLLERSCKTSPSPVSHMILPAVSTSAMEHPKMREAAIGLLADVVLILRDTYGTDYLNRALSFCIWCLNEYKAQKIGRTLPRVMEIFLAAGLDPNSSVTITSLTDGRDDQVPLLHWLASGGRRGPLVAAIKALADHDGDLFKLDSRGRDIIQYIKEELNCEKIWKEWWTSEIVQYIMELQKAQRAGGTRDADHAAILALFETELQW